MTTQDQAQAPGTIGTTNEEEALDLGNDALPSTGTSEAAAPAPAPAPAAAPAAASDAGSGEGSAGTQNVPYARFREVNESRRLLEEQLAAMQQEVQALKAGQPPSPVPAASPPPVALDVDAAEEQYAQALLDGDTKAASAIRREINQHIENSALQRFEQVSQHQQSTALSQAVVERAIQEYPWLDEAEGAVALELIEAAVTLKVAQGQKRHDALAEAISTIAPRFAPAGPPLQGLAGGAGSVDTRLARADKRGAADSLLQPAAVQAGMGNRATAPKIDGSTKLSDEQISGLSKAEMDKALGLA